MSKEKRLFFLFFLSAYCVKAQDTLKINLSQADSIFIAGNVYLLASSMNVEAQKAQIIQARLYPNLVFTVDVNAYDPQHRKPFHVGSTGQKGFQLEQLILLGGKRRSEIDIAKTNAGIAELEFVQLIRELRFRLHSTLFSIGQQQLLLVRYNSQLELLNMLLSAYQTQAEKGNIPLKDVVRLKGAYLKLNNDRGELLKEYFEAQSNLQMLLQTSSLIQFQFSEQEIEKYIKPRSLDEIKKTAIAHHPEVLIMEQNKLLAEQYAQYQKRLAVPDLNVFTSYDQRSGAFSNQLNAGISVPLPFWNRNQGNIRSSQSRIKEADYTLQGVKNRIIGSLQNAYALYEQTISEYRKSTALYNEDFEITVKGMSDNFQKRNVSIVEFIDFFEAYNEVLTELTRIKTQVVISGEQLNLLTGKDFY